LPTRIESKFAALKSEGRMAFMPFVTCGDPDMATTLALIRELSSRGVDLIEVGFPYSDPIADGPVIQASYTRALEKRLHVSEIFAGIASLRGEANVPPLVAMVSYAIIFRMMPARFVDAAQEAGFAGLIVPDLPGDEAAEFAELVRSRGLDLVQLIAPTTPPERVERILKSSSGFVYCISTAGTTGVRDELPPELQRQLRDLREKTRLPLAVGFGISRPDQVATLRGLADGIIIGSAIVRQLEPLANGGGNRAEVLSSVGAFAAQMVAAVKLPR
jgi:tryptophan synthase alpha chain